MTKYFSCMRCKNVLPNFEYKEGKVIRPCKAFPEGIPQEILNNKNDHTKPYPGDNGIMFEPIEDTKEK